MQNNRGVLIVVALSCLALIGAEPVEKPTTRPKTPGSWNFDYSIKRYLGLAVEVEKLGILERAARLRALAADPEHGAEVFPLCRMLFEAKPDGKFRPPGIGGMGYYGDPLLPLTADRGDWPLCPITVFENIPIFVAQSYIMAGRPEPPIEYVDYCLSECNWSPTKFEIVSPEKRKEIVERFIAAHPKMKDSAKEILKQAE